jgi:hypothetical protein
LVVVVDCKPLPWNNNYEDFRYYLYCREYNQSEPPENPVIRARVKKLFSYN